jgi:hypothetical protein
MLESDIERARVTASAVMGCVLQMRPHLDALRDVLGKAQNGPPDGDGDNTIPEAVWSRLNRAAQLFREADDVLRGMF